VVVPYEQWFFGLQLAQRTEGCNSNVELLYTKKTHGPSLTSCVGTLKWQWDTRTAQPQTQDLYQVCHTSTTNTFCFSQDNISRELPDNIINIYRVYLHNEYLKVCTVTVHTQLLDTISFLVLTQTILLVISNTITDPSECVCVCVWVCMHVCVCVCVWVYIAALHILLHICYICASFKYSTCTGT